jgi:hypothetical protein
MTAKDVITRIEDELLPATEGSGPLLERDYWGVIRECRMKPSEVMELVRSRFWEFCPPELVQFRRSDGTEEPLQEGDRLELDIKMAGEAAVCVIHQTPTSVTLATLAGHPEAGRITFGAYRNERGDVIFHIRSRARAGSGVRYAGFLAVGEAMQTNTWTDFIDRVAHMVGEGVVGAIRADTRERDDLPEDALESPSPTFSARGD